MQAQPAAPGVSRRAQLLFFLAGAIALAFLIARANPRQLLTDVRNAGWAVPAIVGVYGLVYALNTVAWRLTMTEEPKLGFFRAYLINVSAFAINYMTPFASIGGEPYKIIAASQWMGTRNGAASVLNYRLVHMQAHLLVFLTGVALAFILLPANTIATPILVGMAAILLVLTGLLLAIHREGVIERLFDLMLRIPLLNRLTRRLEHRRAALVEVDRQLIAFHRASPARYYGSLATEYAARVLSMLEFFIIARAIGHPVSFGTAFLIGGFSSLVVNLFFFMPFNVGSKEGGLYVIFAALGLPARLGVAAAVISRIRELTWITIGLILVLATRRKPDRA
ncbi:MAG: lysylphosphatidylglycerol synthase domain-containing protein [Gemmatimonadales bacterium]